MKLLRNITFEGIYGKTVNEQLLPGIDERGFQEVL